MKRLLKLISTIIEMLFIKAYISITKGIVNIKSNLSLILLKLFASRERIRPRFGI